MSHVFCHLPPLHRWLAIDRDEMTSEVQIPVSIPDGEANAGFLFKQGIFNKLKDDHLFWSVFSRPVRSRSAILSFNRTPPAEKPLPGLQEHKGCVSAWRPSTWQCSRTPCGNPVETSNPVESSRNWKPSHIDMVARYGQMKGYLTDPYFSLTQMLNFSWQATTSSRLLIFFSTGDQRWHHVQYDHLASSHHDGFSLPKVGNLHHSLRNHHLL